MKKLKILVCIAIIIICIQVTYARFVTKQPNGTVKGNIGQAVVSLEKNKIEYTGYDYVLNKPCLYDSDDSITYSFFVNNYETDDEGEVTAISDVNLNYNIYVVFYEKDETDEGKEKVKSDLGYELSYIISTDPEETKEIDYTILEEDLALTINNETVILPKGTIKFTPEELLTLPGIKQNLYKLKIKLDIDSLPTSEVTPRMEMYCEAIQSAI